MLKSAIKKSVPACLVALFIVFILLVALYRKLKGYSGTYNTRYFYDPLLGGGRRPGDGFNTSKKSQSAGEIECRRVLESIFHKPFPSKRPNFMKNPLTGRNLELDCFNAELKIACEYNGRQHYEFLKHFHTNVSAFHKQQTHDKKTRELCIKNGVFLLEVPYTVKHKDIEKYIFRKLNTAGF
jgi:hypothetical protein